MIHKTLPTTIVLALVLAAAHVVGCRERSYEPDASDTQQAVGALERQTNERLSVIRRDFSSMLNQRLGELKGASRLANPDHFKKTYRILIGDTASCFAPSQMLGNVRLGVENEAQQQQLTKNMRAVLDFATQFYEAMGQRGNSLFDTIELCGVGALAKHVPTEQRSKRPMELRARRLVVWNDKFVGGYASIRTDALMSSWSKGDFDSDVVPSGRRSIFEKAWPAINPIGSLRLAIRSRLIDDKRQAQSEIQRVRSIGTSGDSESASFQLVSSLSSPASEAFEDTALSHLQRTGVSQGRLTQVLNSVERCVQQEQPMTELEELGTCASLMRTAKVTGDQSNFSLLVGVMNFHNIQVGAGVCSGEGSRALTQTPDNDVTLKQRCVGLLVSVCTVDNVQVLAQMSLVPKALPTLCLARALKESAPPTQPFVFEL